MATAYANHWQNASYSVVEGWADTPKAIELLDRASFLSDLSDTVAGMQMSALSDAISDALLDVENELDDLRETALSEALDLWEGETDEYTADHLEGLVPTVAKALAARRAQVRLTDKVENELRWTMEQAA